MRRTRFAYALLLGCGLLQAWAQPLVVAERLQRHVTVYQSDFAFFSERWQARLPEGQVEVLFPELPPTAEPATLTLLPHGASVLRQSFRPTPSSGMALLESLRGHTVRFISADGQQVIEGKLLEVLEPYAVLKTATGILLLPSPTNYRVLVEEEALLGRRMATLQALLSSPRAGLLPFDIGYQVNGLGWRMLYTLRLPVQGEKLTLCGFAVVENRSGVAYDSLHLHLVAGSVSRRAPAPYSEAYALGIAVQKSPEAIPPAPQALSGFYRYDIPHVHVLRPQESLQIPVVGCTAVRFERLYRLESSADRSGVVPIVQLLRFANSPDNGLGQPLPAGTVQLLATSGDSLFFVGESPLPETPIGDTLELSAGPAFDLKAQQQLLERREVAGNLLEETYQLTLLNGSQEAVRIQVRFRLRWDQQNWRLVAATHPHWRHDATTVAFEVPVAARGQTQLRFTVQSQRPAR